MIGELFTAVDGQLAVVLPEAARLVLWATISGAVSMALYACTSPQQRLRALREETAGLQRQLATYDGEFRGAMALARRNLGLSLQRLGWALGPSLLAGAPVILVLIGLASAYEGYQLLTIGPAWAGSWWCGYLVVTTIAALSTKLVFKID